MPSLFHQKVKTTYIIKNRYEPSSIKYMFVWCVQACSQGGRFPGARAPRGWMRDAERKINLESVIAEFAAKKAKKSSVSWCVPYFV